MMRARPFQRAAALFRFLACLSVWGILASLSFSSLLLSRSWAAESHFYRGNEAEPETLDPQKSSTLSEAHILRDLFEGLLIQDAAGALQPGVASSWTISADGKTYVFTLRPEARWSNGAPVTADDFVFSLRRLVDPATAAEYANILYPVHNAEAVNTGKMPPRELGVRALDPHRLEIVLGAPTPYFLELLTHQTTAPVNRENVTAYGNSFTRPGGLVSNGAYVLTENVPGSHIRLRKNAAYYDAAKVAIDIVDYVLVKDLAAGVRRFKAGEIDLLPDVPADQLKSLRESVGDRLKISPLQGIIYLTFNTGKAPFSDKRVRQALAMIIDRDFLAEDIANGTILAAERFVPPGTAFAGPRPPAPPWAHLSSLDREKLAKNLLKEAGFSPAKPLAAELRYNITDNNKAMAVAIADMWSGIGVSVRLIATDSRSHFAYLREKGDYDVARAGWVADYDDPQNFLFILESGSGLNYARWKDERFDRIMRDAAGELMPEKRAGLLADAENLMLDETPVTPLAFYTSRYLISPRLHGFMPNLRAANATRYLHLAP